MTASKTSIGTRLHAIRTELGLSQLALATTALSARASSKNIGRIEQGEVFPTIETLEKIAVATDTDFQWLLTGKAQVEEGRPVRVPGIGARVHATRTKRGMSQREAAAHLSDSPSAQNVGRIERGDVRPTPRTLRSLANGMDTSMHYLVNGK